MIEAQESKPAYMAGFSSRFDYECAQEDDAETLRDYAEKQFARAAFFGDANAIATWAPMVNDFDRAKKCPRPAGTPMPQKYQTFGECMADSLDYTKGPQASELYQLLLNAAKSEDWNIAEQASLLLDRMGKAFAHNNT